MTTNLIFCAGRNVRYAEIALRYGFAYGCRSDYRPLFPVVFADLNWRRPDLDAHLGFVRECQRWRERCISLQGSLRDAEQLLLRQGEVLAENERLRERVQQVEQHLEASIQNREDLMDAQLGLRERIERFEAALHVALDDLRREAAAQQETPRQEETP